MKLNDDVFIIANMNKVAPANGNLSKLMLNTNRPANSRPICIQ